MDRCEQEQRQSEYDKAYYNVPPKHMLPFFFQWFIFFFEFALVVPFDAFRRDPRSRIYFEKIQQKNTHTAAQSYFALRIMPYLPPKPRKKSFPKKEGNNKKKVWIIMDTSSKKSLNQFDSVDGCNHTHHTRHIHHIHHNTIPLIPTPHHTNSK